MSEWEHEDLLSTEPTICNLIIYDYFRGIPKILQDPKVNSKNSSRHYSEEFRLVKDQVRSEEVLASIWACR